MGAGPPGFISELVSADREETLARPLEGTSASYLKQREQTNPQPPNFFESAMRFSFHAYKYHGGLEVRACVMPITVPKTDRSPLAGIMLSLDLISFVS